jgi:hypothetical protein
LQEAGQDADQPLIEALLQNVEESLPDNTGDKAYTTIVEKTQAEYEPVKVNPDFKKVGVLLDQKRAMAMPKELPTNQGQRINLQRLPRLMTDGKVFGSGKPKKVKKKKVFFLVADSSGSINSTVGYDKLIQALEGVRQSIQIGRNQAYVLAYTTKVVREETHPYLEVLATPDGLPKISGYEDMKHSFTPESFILETLEKWIKGRIPPKYDPYIIILNDGEPYMPEVETEIMVRRARKQVRRFRELGVKVLAFALTPEVYANDVDIYGADNTVKAYGGLLEQALMTVLQKLP